MIVAHLFACGEDGGVQSRPLRFVDETERVGLSYRQSDLDPSGACLTSDESCEPEYMTGGAALGDVDGDGLTDVFVTRLGDHDLLFLNRGGRFEDASVAYGLDAVAADSNGAALFDADLDGDLDLYVTVLGPPGASAPNDRYHFFDNEGGRFVLRGEERGLAFAGAAGRGGTSIAVGDYDRDGYPDLHINEWRASDPANVVTAPNERLLHNRGEPAPGHFEDVTVAAGVFLAGEQCRLEQRGCTTRSFASTFTDLDDDGWPDLAVLVDFGRSRLFWNRGDGTFEDGTTEAGVGTDENGMGSTFGDFDGDGDLDWFVSAISVAHCEDSAGGCGWGTTGNRLYRNEGGRRFTDVTDEFGVRHAAWGWGAAFFDPDLDGDLDLTMTSGYDVPQEPTDGGFGEGRIFTWQSTSGGMTAVADTGLASRGQGRGLCVFDADGDGDEDVFVVEHGSGGRLFHNVGADGGASLAVRVLGPHGRAVAYGARVSVQVSPDAAPQVREIGTGHHFLCAPEPLARFGLGGASRVAHLEVRWPSGQTVEMRDVDAGQVIEVIPPE